MITDVVKGNEPCETHSSYAGLTRVSIKLHKRLAKRMDRRVKPGNDEVRRCA
jgi:hypothetical protein